MKVKLKKWLVFALIFTSLPVILLWISGLIVSIHGNEIVKRLIKKNIPRLTKLDFESCQANFFTQSLMFKKIDLIYEPAKHSRKQYNLTINQLKLDDVHLWKFIFSEKLNISDIIIKEGQALIKNGANDSSSVEQDLDHGKYEGIEIGRIEIENLKLISQDDSLRELEATINISSNKISIPWNDTDSHTNSLLGEIENVLIKDIIISPKKSFYNWTVATIEMNRNYNVSVDSIQLIPKYAKFDFGRHAGRQTDRFELLIPQLKASQFGFSRDSVFNASTISFDQLRLIAFRDKRLPFIKENEVPLPIEWLMNIYPKFKIDTIQINDASIMYEEFPINGDSTGQVRFNKLRASIYNLGNCLAPSVDHVDVDVETIFMQSGLLKASFDLPFNKKTKYSTKGSLTDLSLTTLNAAIEPLAMLRIKSGELNSLDFSFTYDELYSDGTVELNYENLKIISLKEKESKAVIDRLKTFLLNTFFIQRNENEKRTGRIKFERDPKRSVFNYWLKSLLSGIKSSNSLDKQL